VIQLTTRKLENTLYFGASCHTTGMVAMYR